MTLDGKDNRSPYRTTGHATTGQCSRKAAWLLIAVAVMVFDSAAALPAPAPPASERVAAAAAEVESQLASLEVSIERASHFSAHAPHRLFAETRAAVARLAAARQDLIGQPWQVAMPLLRRLDLAETRARTLLARLEDWRRATTPTQPVAPQGTGTITGTVRVAATGLPLAGVRVNVVGYYSGTLLASTLTDATGSYTAGGLGTSEVSVRTTGTPGYIDVAYDGHDCEPGCSSFYGTYLVVPDGTTLAGIDFDLVAAATLSGTVTSAADGSPIAGIEIAVRRFDSDSTLAQATTGADGTYTIPELPPGQFRVLASSAQWADEAFDNVPCEPSCGSMAGTPVFLAAGQSVGGVDFGLDRTGSLSGRVYNPNSGAGMYAAVRVYDAAGGSVAYAYSSRDPGAYSLEDLPAGTYYAGAMNWPWKELYRELAWPDPFDPTLGTPITVVGGQDTPGIDFTYSTDAPEGGSISGQIVSAATGLALQGNVAVFDVAGNLVTSRSGVDTGYYLVTGLAPGEYFVTASAPQHLAELYDNFPCPSSCDPRTGTPVLVAADTPTEGIDFALELGGWIAGRVTGADSGEPLHPVFVDVFDAAGDPVSTDLTDGTGHYVVFGLGTGSYFVRASRQYSSSPGYAPQLFSGILCEEDCDLLTGTPVPVVAGLPTNGIDFALTPLGRVTGTVTDAATGLPIAGATVYVRRISWYEFYATTDSQGNYSVDRIPSGPVRVLAADARYRDELYDNIPCEQFTCSPDEGTPVSVAAGTTTEHIDFALHQLGTVQGRVTRAADGQPLQNVAVRLYRPSETSYAYAYSDAAGYYEIVGREAGTYFARTADSPSELVDELYDNLPCEPSCTPSTGTPITVMEGQTTAGIDFALETGGTIAGRVTDEQTGTPVPDCRVTVHDASGASVSTTSTASDGSFTLRGLPTGSYFVRASRENYGSHAGELYDNVPCDPSCTVTTGTPVAVATGGTVTGIDFALDRLGGISGSVTKAGGGALAHAEILVYDENGNVAGETWSGDLGQYYVQDLAPGTYFVKASAMGYVPEVYDNVPCDSGCDVNSGTPVTVAPGTATTGIDFALQPRGRISGRVTEDPDGSPVPGIRLVLYTQTGTWFQDAASDSQGSYSFTNLPQGSYFVRTESAGHFDELYDNIPCEIGCVVTTGTPVAVTVGTVTSGIDFALARRGAIAGAVRDNITGAPVKGQVSVYDHTGAYVSSDSIDPMGRFKIMGLPPGTYFAVASSGWPKEHLDELYNDIPCDGGCTVTNGTPIAVAEGTTTTGIDFVLRRNGRITGRVTDATFGLPVLQRWVRFFDANGNYVSHTSADAAGNFSSTYLGPGTYYVATQSYHTPDPWIDQLWEGRECEPSCTPTLGTPVVVTPDTITSGINFALYKQVFADIPIDHWARSFVHAIYRHGITAGCSSDPLVFCPASLVNRAQNAVFLGVAGHGTGFAPPPPTGAVFDDVPAGYWAAGWIEQLWADGLTSGCATNPLRFCPESDLTRAEMAVFLLAVKYGPAYQPPPATGTLFADVPATHWAAASIEQLAAEGITAGCAPGLFCPDGVVDRAQMAVFLVTTFSIPH
ncbi:MAG TPA: carboxypeptidase regulatory-like domain-containing protein [Thermoanaerobaculaceae bacterium]|nr:carboxypeptidase regulatory-like domain-containing protein [Thermoanaerobaculaceae bacterium]HRS16572.1 carboxypeptidase regulatory-like domain-containing protein [Thermoanaerobaculaceae bacterium]